MEFECVVSERNFQEGWFFVFVIGCVWMIRVWKQSFILAWWIRRLVGDTKRFVDRQHITIDVWRLHFLVEDRS